MCIRDRCKHGIAHSTFGEEEGSLLERGSDTGEDVEDRREEGGENRGLRQENMAVAVSECVLVRHKAGELWGMVEGRAGGRMGESESGCVEERQPE
eukprot:3848743-Rhodomonas_salina.1